MAKRVFLYRHAKSDWDADYSSDHERPLAKRGIKAAKWMGMLLSKSGQVPGLAITSSAKRAGQTLELSMLEGSWNSKLEVEEKLYYGSIDEIFKLVKSVSDEYSSVMFVGHEPKTAGLCSLMIGGGDIVFPTASIARVDFAVDEWSSLEYGSGQLRWLLQPSFFTKGKFAL